MQLDELTQTHSFKDQLAQLISYRKDYHDLPEVLEEYFKEIKDNKALVDSTYCMQHSGGMALHKIRIKRKGSGSSSGYRLIFTVFYPQMDVRLLTIYPKTGKYGKNNATTAELKELVKKSFEL